MSRRLTTRPQSKHKQTMKTNKTTRKTISVLITACLLCLSAPFVGQAATPASTPTNYSLGGAINNTQGWAFTANQPFTLNALGVFDFANDLSGPTPDGLQLSKHISLWTSGGTLIAEATVPAGTSGTVVGTFRYTLTSPIAVPPGNYVIGAAYGTVGNQGDPDEIVFTSTFATDPAITITDGRYRLSGDGFPDSSGTVERFGPNMLVTTVPEPNAGLLIGLGAVGFFSRHVTNVASRRTTRAR